MIKLAEKNDETFGFSYDFPREKAFIQSIYALDQALTEEFQKRLEPLLKIYNISQMMIRQVAFVFLPENNTTKDQNEYKSDVNPF